MKEVAEQKNSVKEAAFKIDPNLKSNPNDPIVLRKVARAEEILANLKEPLTKERIQMLRQGKVSK